MTDKGKNVFDNHRKHKIFLPLMVPMIMMLMYQAVHWYMRFPDNYKNIYPLASVYMGPFTGCYITRTAKEAKGSQ